MFAIKVFNEFDQLLGFYVADDEEASLEAVRTYATREAAEAEVELTADQWEEGTRFEVVPFRVVAG